MKILGLHSGATINQHDPGAALVCDGDLVAACEEERFVRIKSPRGFLPIHSIRHCLSMAEIGIEDVDLVVNPGASHVDVAGRVGHYLRHYFGHSPEVRLINHQHAHIAGAYYCSGFDEAMCVSYDSYGDKLSGALAVGNGKGIEILDTIPYDNSLGTFYGTMTSYLGFQGGEDEYKVMGLAANGKAGIDLSKYIRPTQEGYYVDTVNMCRHIEPNATIYEAHYSDELVEYIGQPPRLPGGALTQFHCDVAYATQKALEACVTSLATHLHSQTGSRNLCISGGVALNCVANHKLLELPFVDAIYVCPPASDRGLPLGCALEGANMAGERVATAPDMFLGPEYDDGVIQDAMRLTGTVYREVDEPETLAAEMLADGRIVGWYQGRSEYGPRALGNRSILADPRSPAMKDEINAKVKYREEFRPFAPSVLEERASELFEMDAPSPFMTVTFPVRPEWQRRLGAVTHVDGSARVQTVSSDSNPRFHRLIREFDRLTSVPAILNTSFNARGEPITESPLDALRTFAATGLDAMFMGDYLVEKPKRPRNGGPSPAF